MSASDTPEDFESGPGEIEHIEINGHAFEVRAVLTEHGEGVEICLSPEDTRRFRMTLDFDDETVADIIATKVVVYNGDATIDVDGTEFTRAHDQLTPHEHPDQVAKPGIYIKSNTQETLELIDKRSFTIGDISVRPLEEGVFSREGIVVRCIGCSNIFSLDGKIIGETRDASTVVPRSGITEVKDEENVLVVRMD